MEQRADTLTQGLLGRFRATLDLPEAELGLHWCLNLPDAPTAALGRDGHPPHPVDLPRRMWAASSIEFHAPLTVGITVTRDSKELSRREKTGRSGRLVFVELAHEVRGDRALAVRERQTIVYRDDAKTPPSTSESVEQDGGWQLQREVVATAPLLFRYSALTFNAHRIHYDRPYAQEVEGYPDLVVHGPLLATLLLEVARAELGRVSHFTFRAVAPAFVDQTLSFESRTTDAALELRVRSRSAVCMTAMASP